jgi:hypothetical protein
LIRIREGTNSSLLFSAFEEFHVYVSLKQTNRLFAFLLLIRLQQALYSNTSDSQFVTMNNVDQAAPDAAADAAVADGLPPIAADAAVPPLGGGGAGGDSWENLKDGAGHLPHEVGAALWVSYGGATDEHVVAPLRTMGERAVDADLSNLLRQWVDDPDVKYYLVVIGKRVEVLHQLRACHATAGNGQRNLALLGEHTMVAGIMVPPKLQSLRGAVNNQALFIGLQAVAAPTIDDIAALFAGYAALELVPALQAAQGVDIQIVDAWKLTSPFERQTTHRMRRGTRGFLRRRSS